MIIASLRTQTDALMARFQGAYGIYNLLPFPLRTIPRESGLMIDGWSEPYVKNFIYTELYRT